MLPLPRLCVVVSIPKWSLIAIIAPPSAVSDSPCSSVTLTAEFADDVQFQFASSAPQSRGLSQEASPERLRVWTMILPLPTTRSQSLRHRKARKESTSELYTQLHLRFIRHQVGRINDVFSIDVHLNQTTIGAVPQYSLSFYRQFEQAFTSKP